MNRQISELLYPLGITANYMGYYYISYAIELVSSNPSLLMMVTKDLYPAIAVHFSSTVSRVERNIRRGADLAWQTNPQLLQDMAGHCLLHRPCASQFIAIVSAGYRKKLIPRSPGNQQSFF